MTTSLSLVPEQVRLRCKAGDDATVAFRFSSQGVAVDVSGTHDAQIRREAENPVVLGSFTIDATYAVDGLLLCTLPHALSRTLPSEQILVFDIQWTETSGKLHTLVDGTLYLKADVTR